MAIITDYEAIARRLRELRAAHTNDDHLKQWRGLAKETAEAYVESRRRGAIGDILRRRTQQIMPKRSST